MSGREPTVPMRLLGAVLAGGASRRFGTDKTQAELGGQTMLGRAIAMLTDVVGEVVVISSNATAVPPGVRVIADRRPGMGPLGGLHAALHEAQARGCSGVLALACDLPLLAPDVVGSVASALQGHPIVAPARGDGIEPLCAAYSVSVLPSVERLIDEGALSLHGLFDLVGGVRLKLAGDGEAFLNVNTQADRDRAEAVLEAQEER